MRNSEIYKIRERGQVVTEACQWIVGHNRLAIQLAVRPIAILAIIELANIFFIKSIPFSLIIAFIALLLVPTVPSMMMYVVEHPEEYDYPRRLPKLMELWDLWKKYIVSAIVIGIIGYGSSFLCSVTMVGPFFIEYIKNVALVIHHREENTNFLSAMLNAFSLSFSSFISLLLMMLGTSIITVSMIVGPFVLIFMLIQFIPVITSPSIKEVASKMMDTEMTTSLILECLSIGYILSTMVSLVIAHFFYGHSLLCEEKKKEQRMRRREELREKSKE